MKSLIAPALHVVIPSQTGDVIAVNIVWLDGNRYLEALVDDDSIFSQQDWVDSIATMPIKPPSSLNPVGALATLNVVLGLWPLEHAANIAHVTPDDLVHEAEAWWVASQGGV